MYQLEKAGKVFWVVTGSVLFCIIAYFDYITGNHLSLSFFYLLPVFAFAWGIKGNAGIYAAVISAILWMWIDSLVIEDYSNIFLSLWNGIVRLGFFLLPVFMLKNLEKEAEHARTDYLTGAVNNRHFRYLLEKEIERSARYQHPFSIAFLDLDEFKIINDTFGHTFGDEVLKNISATVRRNLRKTDVIARMGGDEFAILLPETNPQSVRATMDHVIESLFAEMDGQKWRVTFSVGVVTVTRHDLSGEEILRMVDKTMYVVKYSGKNNIKYVVE